MTESENNQEVEQELQELKQELVRAEVYVQTIKQKISFRPLGQRSKWTSELTVAKKKRDRIASDLKRIEAKGVFEETDALIKDFDEKEKIAKEKKRVLSLFNEYKEKPIITVPIEKQMEKPNFSEIGDKIIDLNQVELENAQREFNSAKRRASKHSPVGAGDRASQLQKARNRLDKAMFDLTHLPILTNFRDLFAEKKYLDMIIKEQENEIEEVQAIISKVEKDIVLFKKYGLIKLKK